MRKTLLSKRQSADTTIEAQFWQLDSGQAGLDIVVIRDSGHKQTFTFYNPADVTAWFTKSAAGLVSAWQDAYHKSAIDSGVFHRPDLTVGGTYTVTDETELWQVAEHALNDGKRWTEIWALNPDVHSASLTSGQIINLPGPAFGPRATGSQQGDVLLKVPYLSQRDNKYYPGGTCNVTSYAMALTYLGVRPRDPKNQLEDELSQYMLKHGKDRHNHADLVWVAREYGAQARFGMNRTWAQIREEIRAGRPVVVSGKFTQSGHIIAIIGLHGDDFIVHDPWGNAMTGYKSHNGRQVLYPFAYMHAKTRALSVDAKWAHFFSV